MAPLRQSRQLKKELSLFGVYTLATGATLSSGFFLLPGLAAAEAGPAVVLSYMLAVLPLLPGILSKIELATAMPRAGGEYYFIDRSMGPLPGTIGGLGTWCGLVLKTAFALIGIGAYLGLLIETRFDLTIPVAVGAALFFGLINLFGARKSASFQSLLVCGLLALLLWFMATGLVTKVDGANHFADFWAGGPDQNGRGPFGIFTAAGLVCVSFMGMTNVASVAEEVKDPERNLPRGIFLALLTAVIVYGLGTYVIVKLVPPATLYSGGDPSLTPVADAARAMPGGKWAVMVMTVAALLAFFSVVNAGILSASRYPLAMSRDHLIPGWFRTLSPQMVPRRAILVTVGLLLLFVTVFDPAKLAKLASAFLLLLFAFNCLAVLVMRESHIDSYDPGYRSPFYPWLQFVGILSPLVFIILMGWLPSLFAAGLIGLGTFWYFFYGQKRVARGGAIYHLFHRWGQRRYVGLDRELRSILKEKGLRADDPYDQVVASALVVDEGPAVTFEQLVQRASEQLAVHLPLDAAQLAASFMDGTRVGATPVSKGVALPHVRLSGIDRPWMVLARAVEGVYVKVDVDFVEHSSEQAIYAVIFLVSHEEDAAQHLRILAQVAQHVDNQQFLRDWLAAETEPALKEVLLREDRFTLLELDQSDATSTLIGRALRDAQLPSNTLVALIHRNDQMVVPRGGTILCEGDRLTIVGLPESILALKAQFF